MKEAKEQEMIQINVQLDGDDAARFLRYKQEQKIKANAAAAYKLMAERLEQLTVQPAAAA